MDNRHRPIPVLDGKNYPLWKQSVRTYIKSIDARAWKAVIVGYDRPMINDDDGDRIPKPEENYTDEEMAVQNFNDKALNAIITNIDYNLFRLIQNCKAGKDAWEILERQFEGDKSVKKS